MPSHFVIICFPIQGHINPTLQLAKNLARAGAKVTFATTTPGITRLHNHLPSLANLSYATFSDGHDDEENLPTAGNFTSYMADLRRAGPESLTELLKKFPDAGNPATCLVYTILLPWAATVAREVQIPSVFLSIQCATALAIYHRFLNSDDGLYNGGNIESSVSVKIESLPLFSLGDLPTYLLPEHPMNSLMVPLMQEHIQELEKETESCVFLNTFQELEQPAIKTFENKLNVLPIGPLIPSAFLNANDSNDKSFGGDLFSEGIDYIKWLDEKNENSVIYISFGSLVMINKEQKEEILHGLLESKRPFLWVIRASDNDDELIKKMVENEVNGLIVPWCSQIEVLSHKSIGCFVTHCGWNSTLESIVCGVPLIGFPEFSDQTTDAKMVEEVWGIGVRARLNGQVMVEKDEFKKCLDIVMGEGERGKEIRCNAKKWKGSALEAVKDGGSTSINMTKVLDMFELKES